MIGLARPTRGLEFSESSDSIEKNLRGHDSIEERSWDLDIPDSFNEVTAKLLDQSSDLIWFVEEDVVVPPGILEKMLELINQGYDIVAVNYFLKRQPGVVSEKRDDDGNLLWVSLGCTLVKRAVFEGIAEPWFMTGYSVASCHTGSSCVKRAWKLVKTNYPYGGQDAYFCWKAKEAGFKMVTLEEITADHLVLNKLGESDQNAGCHDISKVDKTVVKKSKRKKKGALPQ